MFRARRTVLSLALAASAVVLGACASLPSTDEMRQEVAGFELPKLPEDGKAIVYVVRPSPLGPLIRFNVFIDDQEATSEMGWNRGAQYFYFNLEPGTRKIFSQAENLAEIEVKAAAGDVIVIQQHTNMGFIMARNSLQALELDPTGKYYIKTLSPGTTLRRDKAGPEIKQ